MTVNYYYGSFGLVNGNDLIDSLDINRHYASEKKEFKGLLLKQDIRTESLGTYKSVTLITDTYTNKTYYTETLTHYKKSLAYASESSLENVVPIIRKLRKRLNMKCKLETNVPDARSPRWLTKEFKGVKLGR